MSPEEWIKQNTFFCPHLQARITNTQCCINREHARTNGSHDKTVHPCVKCEEKQMYEIYQGNSKGEQGMTFSDQEPKESTENTENIVTGLEGCDIHVPRKNNKNVLEINSAYISKYKFIKLSDNILDMIPEECIYFMLGYDSSHNNLKIKFMSEETESTQKAAKNTKKLCYVAGAFKRWNLGSFAGGTYLAKYNPDNYVVTIYLGKGV